jgi:hypothetical protein
MVQRKCPRCLASVRERDTTCSFCLSKLSPIEAEQATEAAPEPALVEPVDWPSALVATAPRLNGREELLAMGDKLWGSERVIFSEGLRRVSAIAAWRLPREPAQWMVMTLGNTVLDEALCRYELSGRGYEFICRVVAPEVPTGLLSRLDQLSGTDDLDAALRNRSELPDPSEPRRMLSSDVPALETVNGRVSFVRLLAPVTGDEFDEATSSPDFRVPSRQAVELLAVGREHAKPAVAFNVKGESDSLVFDPKHRSHVGGMAQVPTHFDWPTADGRKLPLMLELHLEEVGPTPLLPSSGRLLFFGFGEEVGGSFDAPTEWFQLRWVDGEGQPRSGELMLPERPVCFVRFEDPLPWRMLESHTLVQALDEPAREEALADYAERSSLRMGHGYHQLLGYQHPVQDDAVIGLLIALRGLEYPVDPLTWSALEIEAASEWVTLLQLESSGSPEWDFVGGGKLFVICRRSDVLERRFERAEVVLQR